MNHRKDNRPAPTDEARKRSFKGALEALGVMAAPAGVVGLLCQLFGLDGPTTAAASLAVICITVPLWYSGRVPLFIALALALGLAAVTSLLSVSVTDPCLVRAVYAHRPYAIHTATYSEKLERVAGRTDRVLKSRRINYYLQATRRILPTEDLFKESYDTHHPDATTFVWRGSEEENRDISLHPGYAVTLDLHRFDFRSIVTGMDFEVPFPYGRRQNEPGLGKFEDTLEFSNDAESPDVICGLVMIVESSTMALSNAHLEAITQGSKGGDNKPSAELHQEGNRYTITARWQSLQPGEGAHLLYSVAP